ncbi:hypothetical protein AQ745_11190 [Burkholderia pseudomallei]|nr:hypothetical protein AQ740_15640 [Burkholderia pseudomallei]OMS54401.1 hypothetical protein AQ744_11335 [Burkholderia pseudomallei]OMS55007.1 hypothetical protein AQ743_29440 [Burkholderia pseudomallei]OMS69910.1 hypothetical protein AQ745_11190 [Burkholderia pseudomallei]OMS75488.1 hypothetical protein AQ747_16215 [Burkholderia pseudomallei]
MRAGRERFALALRRGRARRRARARPSAMPFAPHRAVSPLAHRSHPVSYPIAARMPRGGKHLAIRRRVMSLPARASRARPPGFTLAAGIPFH